jgi:hypothetical protein
MIKKKPLKFALSARPVLRGLIIFILFAGLLVTAYFSTGSYATRFYEGEIALKDIYAPFDFEYPGGVDEVKTEKLRQQAIARIKPVYDMRPDDIDEAEGLIKLFMQEGQKQLGLQTEKSEKIDSIKKVIGERLSENEISDLLEELNVSKGALTEKIYSLFAAVTRKPIVGEETLKSLKDAEVDAVTLREADSEKSSEMEVSRLIARDKLRREVEDLAGKIISERNQRRIALSVVAAFTPITAEENPKIFEQKREQALAVSPTVYQSVPVQKNELIISKGQKITEKQLSIFSALNKLLARKSRYSYMAGLGLLLALLFMIGVFYIKEYDYHIFRNTKDLVLIGLIFLISAVALQIVAAAGFPSYFVPVAAASMLVAILLGPSAAFLLTVVLAILGSIVYSGKVDVAFMILAGGSVGIFSIKSVRKRFDIIKAGFLVGLTNFFVISAFSLLNNVMSYAFLMEASLGFLSGITASFIVMGLLPFFEWLFKITTDVTLLELSDLNHPLLQEMVLKAPATYHHSVLVGNLAEAAANSIGANSLLARVGAYYHDIGKIGKPDYFSENETEFRSRHRALTPSMSALIITAHVKDGIELAKKSKISEKIVDFIRQHHGSGLVNYFYQRALEGARDKPGEKVNESGFRYPGPKPQTKEAAIVLLADSAEAASRSIENPTAARIKGLVQRVINNKFVEGQLDECDLTLKELNKIADSFTRVLTAVYHTRVNYEREKENGS